MYCSERAISQGGYSRWEWSARQSAFQISHWKLQQWNVVRLASNGINTLLHSRTVVQCKSSLTYAVLRILGCTLYSFANTNGTIPCGSAACCTSTRIRYKAQDQRDSSPRIFKFDVLYATYSGDNTWTIATLRSSPRMPRMNETAAMTAGPVINRAHMAYVARTLPQGIRLGWRAMNRPVHVSNH